MMATSKGYKVTDADRKTRVGIAVKTLEDLKKKTIEKFKLAYEVSEIDFQTPDGTIVENEEYFQSLPAQCLLIWVKCGERAQTDAEILYKTIEEVNENYLKAGKEIEKFFSEKMKTKVFKLAEVLKSIDSEKVNLSNRTDHPEWFEGLDTRSKSKEEYLFRRAQERIRNYFYKTRDDLLHTPNLPINKLNSLFTDLQTKLKLNKYHGHLFDRSSFSSSHPKDLENNKPLCNKLGLFQCDGRWDKEICLYLPPHSINPYKSREERIIFQTWNLDHQIERSRSILPSICNALGTIQKKKNNIIICNNNNKNNNNNLCYLDVKTIYRDLFTMDNLKFVHIVCHDKSSHSTKKARKYLMS